MSFSEDITLIGENDMLNSHELLSKVKLSFSRLLSSLKLTRLLVVTSSMVFITPITFAENIADISPITEPQGIDLPTNTSSESRSPINNSLIKSDTLSQTQLHSSTQIEASFDTMQMVGEADMDLLWFSIYSAKLMSVDGEYQQNQFPLKLEIEYHRDIEAEDLIEATVDQWQHIGIDNQDIARLQQQIEQAWPDVKEGDKLSFMMHNQNLGQFYFNDQALPIIQEPGFAAAFLDIWLSEQTSRPELRQELIGATK